MMPASHAVATGAVAGASPVWISGGCHGLVPRTIWVGLTGYLMFG